MTQTAAPPAPAPATDGPTATSTSPATLWRRARGPLAFLVVVVLIAVLFALTGDRPRQGILEPEGPNPEGARALVRILQERGADVTVARATDDAVAAASPDSVTVVALSHRLPQAELDRLAKAPGDRVLVEPTTPALRTLAPGVRTAGRADDGTLDPECGLPAARAAGSAGVGGEVYSVEGGDPEAACYPADDTGAALVRVAGPGGGATTVLGSRAPLTNARLADEGNAALALNLLAGRDVVWFVPDVPEQGGQATLWELVPVSLRLSLVPLTAALLLLALWRGRRLGPLVTERLPVVVRAAETTEGRARLYAGRRARDRAAAALRSGVVDRVRPGLGLGPDASPEAVVEAAAARTGDDPATLRALLYGPREGPDGHTTDDNALVRLAGELDRLEERLR